MAFPVIESGAITNAGGSSLSVVMPEGIVAGDLLICVIGIDGSSLTVTPPADWQMPVSNFRSQISSVALWKVADGADSLVVGMSAARTKEAFTYRISGHGHSAAEPPEFSAPLSTIFDAAPAPAELAPSWGSADTLWLAGFVMDDGSKDVISRPAEYTLSPLEYDSNATSSVLGAFAGRHLNATSETPGAFATSAVDQWLSYTIAIKPAGGSARARVPLMLTPW